MDEIIICPNCNEPIMIEKINCGIFRHGSYKDTGKQIGPHSSKEKCDSLKQRDLIYGCGKPFQIILQDNKMVVQVCEYI
jgi:hypothetical protein|uniref:Uncharacterized protein n=1 Tax=viral metagenome TaxID=1070528 RepID=A0A6C0JNG7_9ZZZZ